MDLPSIAPDPTVYGSGGGEVGLYHHLPRDLHKSAKGGELTRNSRSERGRDASTVRLRKIAQLIKSSRQGYLSTNTTTHGQHNLTIQDQQQEGEDSSSFHQFSS